MRPEVTPGPPWRFPTPEKFHLDNGLEVWAFHLPGQYVISGHLMMEVGLDAEPRDLEGVASLALHIIDEGTRSHPDGKISELIDAQGVGVSGRQHHNTTQVSLDAPITRLTAALPLFAEVVREPDSAPAEVEHYRSLLIASHEQRLASPRGVSSLALPKAIYAAHDRRTRPNAGTAETLRRITREDVLAWQRSWGPIGSTLILAGELPCDLHDQLNATFGDWTPQALCTHSPPDVLDTPRVLVVDRPDAVQADLLLSQYSIGRSDPRLPAATVAGSMLGGGFTNRLNLRVREELGYTYAITGGFSPGRYNGSFGVTSSFRLEVFGDAIAETLRVLRLEEDFTEAETNACKSFLNATRPLALQTAEDVAAHAAMLVDGHSSVEFIHAFDEALSAVTAAEASDVYRELVTTRPFGMAISGPVEIIVAALEDQGLKPEVVEV